MWGLIHVNDSKYHNCLIFDWFSANTLGLSYFEKLQDLQRKGGKVPVGFELTTSVIQNQTNRSLLLLKKRSNYSGLKLQKPAAAFKQVGARMNIEMAKVVAPFPQLILLHYIVWISLVLHNDYLETKGLEQTSRWHTEDNIHNNFGFDTKLKWDFSLKFFFQSNNWLQRNWHNWTKFSCRMKQFY